MVKTVHPYRVLNWGSKQSSLAEWSKECLPIKSLTRAQNSSALLSGQDSLSLSSPYLGLKAVQSFQVVKTVYLCRVLIWVSKQSSPTKWSRQSIPAKWSRQSIPVECLFSSKNSPALLNGQDSPFLSNLYLELKAVQPCLALFGGLDSPLPSFYHRASYSG